MPVHEVSPGRWRWGTVGKVYRSRAAAERQGRAIRAAGWKEDGRPQPIARAKLHRALSPPRKAEGRYARDLASIMSRVHEGVFEVLRREWPTPEHRRDKDEDAFGAPFRRRLFRYLDREVGKAHDRMADDVGDHGAAAAKLLGISPQAAGLGGIVAGARAQNVDLMQAAGQRFVDDVRKVLDESDGLRHEEIARLLEERAGVSRRHAELIARDQTAKLAGKLNHARQRAAGITAFTWSTSQDERVRESHDELEGEQFDYDDPPIVDGEPTLPTEAVNCRCVAIPVIDFGDDEEEEAEEPDEEVEAPAPEPAPEPVTPPVPEIVFEPPVEPVAEPEPPAPVLDLDKHFGAVHEQRGAGMEAADVVAAMKHEGVADWVKRLPPNLSVVRSLATAEGKAEGYWEAGEIKIAADISPPNQQDRAWGDTWRVTDKRNRTVEDKVRSNFVHELGHHVHLGALYQQGRDDVDAVIRAAYQHHAGGDPETSVEAAKRVARILHWKTPSPAISRYAMQNHAEYFAESFAAYIEEPEALAEHDPTGHSMVARVLRLIGAE